MKWFIKCLKDYATFSGRAQRSEYWYFTLFVIIFYIVARVLDFTLFGDNETFGPLFSPISWLLTLALIVPGIAVSVRRLHDTGRSGKILLWYYLAGIVWFVAVVVALGSQALLATAGDGLFPESAEPSMVLILVASIGGLALLAFEILLLVWYCTNSQPGENKYGPNPKQVEE